MKLFNITLSNPIRRGKTKNVPVVTDIVENPVIKFAQWVVDFTDELLIRVCQVLLMLGFVAGTIAILSSKFGINQLPWFNLTWAVIQATAIDGLFFAVWGIWRKTENSLTRAWYFFIGCLLGVVAALVNDVVSYSELHNGMTIAHTMDTLGITESTFSLGRSILVVLVAILIVTLPRHTRVSNATGQPDTLPSSELQPIRDSITELSQIVQTFVSEAPINTEPHIQIPNDTVLSELLLTRSDEIDPIIPDKEKSDTKVTLSKGNRTGKVTVKEMVRSVMGANPDLSVSQYAEIMGKTPDSIKKYVSAIRREMTPVEIDTVATIYEEVDTSENDTGKIDTGENGTGEIDTGEIVDSYLVPNTM